MFTYYLLFFELLGIIALFLYGMHLLTSSLESYHRDKLTFFLKNHTNTAFKSIIVGVVLSTLTQSSTATTAIAISLLASHIISLKSSVGVVMGANIGTCFSTIFFSFDLQNYCFIIIFIGVFLFLGTKKESNKHLGLSILGLGIIFLSLYFLESKLLTLFSRDFFNAYIIRAQNNGLLGLFLGTLIAGIIQSSGATIAIAQTLCENDIISLRLALSLMLGANIGTCFTAIFITLFNKDEPKILALSQLWLNIIGALLFLPFVNIYINSSIITSNQALNISFSHFFFNFISTVIGYFFIDSLINLSTFCVYPSFRKKIKKYS